MFVTFEGYISGWKIMTVVKWTLASVCSVLCTTAIPKAHMPWI